MGQSSALTRALDVAPSRRFGCCRQAYSDTLYEMGGMPMSIAMRHMKLVVRDLNAAERFYRAIGLKVVSRNVGGEGEVAQEQS
jgi:hypothetical protein